MRINCPKGRGDLNKILNGIETFMMEHEGIKPSYIIVNYETVNNILELDGISAKEYKLFSIPVAYNGRIRIWREVDIV